MKRILIGIALVGVLALGAFALWHFVLSGNQKGLPVAFARDVWGDVEAGTKTLAPIDAGVTLSGGERMRTRDASRAVLMLRGAGRLIVGEQTELAFLNPVTDDDGRVTAMQVRLVSGSIRVEAAADATAALEVLIGDRVVGVDPGGKLLARVGPEPDQILVSFLDAAGFLVSPGGQRRTIEPNTGIRVSAAVTDPKPIALAVPPELPAGLDDEMRVFSGAEAAALARFTFRKVDAQLRLIIARDPELTDVVVDEVGAGELTATLPVGTYHWAVATVDDAGLTGPFSAARTLEVKEGEAPPAVDEKPSTGVTMRSGESGSVFFTVGVPDVGVDWPGNTDDRRYRLRLSRDKAHTKPVVDTRLEESRYTARGLAPGRYHWTVSAPNGKTHAGNFLVRKVTGTVPAPIKKVNRVDEQYKSTRIVFQREPPTLEFQWKQDARATGGYRLRVGRDEKLTKSVITKRTENVKARVPSGAVAEGTYYWRVERLLADGKVYYPGRVNTLKVQFDNDVPTLELSTPAQGQLISVREVKVEGIAPRGIKLWVNGKRVALEDSGRFSTTAKVDPRRPQIVVRTRRGRRSAYYVRTLRFAPSSALKEP